MGQQRLCLIVASAPAGLDYAVESEVNQPPRGGRARSAQRTTIFRLKSPRTRLTA
jgi:hypothetical protein